MAVGDRINYSNIVNMTGSTAWRNSYGDDSRGSFTFYIHAPVFYVTYTISGSGIWGYQEGSIYIDGLLADGSWQNLFGSYQYLEGDRNSYTWNFHFCDGDSGQTIGSTSLFRLRIYVGDNSGSGRWKVYTGGMEKLSEKIYNQYYKGEKIKGCMCEMNTKQWSLTNNPLRGTRISYENNTYNLLGTY